jgi:hypothetical protein
MPMLYRLFRADLSSVEEIHYLWGMSNGSMWSHRCVYWTSFIELMAVLNLSMNTFFSLLNQWCHLLSREQRLGINVRMTTSLWILSGIIIVTIIYCKSY